MILAWLQTDGPAGAELPGVERIITAIGGLPVIIAVILLLGAFPIVWAFIQAWRDKGTNSATSQERKERDQLFVQALDRQAQANEKQSAASEKTANAVDKLADVMQQGQIQRASESAKFESTLMHIAETLKSNHAEIHSRFDRLEDDRRRNG